MTSESNNILEEICWGTFRMVYQVWKTPWPDFTFSFLTPISLVIPMCVNNRTALLMAVCYGEVGQVLNHI